MKKITLLHSLYKSKIGVLVFFAFCTLFASQVKAQTVASPCDARPFCSDSSYNFPNTSGNTVVAPPSPPVNYGILFSEPNPIWYYMQIGVSGPMELHVYQTAAGTGLGTDVDFAMWGPFTDIPTGCAAILAGAAPIQSSYDGGGAGEVVGLGLPGGSGVGTGGPPVPPSGTTPPSAQVGEVYIIILTNYANSAGSISFSQTGGTGSADCGVICGLHASNSGPICQGSVVNLSAHNATDSIQGFTYQWTGPNGYASTQKNPSVIINQSGTFTFNVMSISDAGDTCNQSTDVVVLPTNLSDTTVSVCAGQTYTWFGKLYYTQGVYDTTFTNVLGCDSTIRLHLIVNPLPDVTLKGSPDINICEGSSAVLSLLNPIETSTYNWAKDGNLISGEAFPTFRISQAGHYTVLVTTDSGCTALSAPFNVVVNPNPVAKIAPISGDVICSYDTLELTATAGAGFDYRWTPEKPFRIVTGADGQKVKGVFIDLSTDVVLTVFNQFGCFDSDTIKVLTKPCCEVSIPNAFTPNGDGTNDYFAPLLQPGQILISFSVYDRYGKQVYNNEDIKKGWNGLYKNGQEANQGVYMYYMKYTCSDGKLYEKKESITLIR